MPIPESSPAFPTARLRRGALAALALAFAAPRLAAADPAFARSFAFVLARGAAPAEFRLGLTPRESTEIRLEDVVAAAEAGEEREVVSPPPKPRPFWIGVVTVAAIAGSALNSFTDGPSQSFRFHNEQWFGRHTYAGGADKVSHFNSYNTVAKLMSETYRDLGVPPDRALVYGSAVSALAGLVTEIGDGTNKYGFSYEDLISDTAGAATAYVTARYGLDDLLGFRTGIVPHPQVIGQPNGGFGKDYTEEIYTADVKIAGLARRMHFRPGLARFLLVSTTYAAKGYPYARPELRERQVGLEIGLHITEILRAAGLPSDRWWQRYIYVILDSLRIPYTTFGVQFDLNHKKWRGPGIGDDFAGGP